MDINEIIDPDGVLANLKPSSKKQLLQELAEAGALRTGIESHAIFESLLEREKLGSTGVGNGVAIPHAKLTGMDRMVGVFAHLNKPVAFEAVDDQPVDIVFMLLAPVAARSGACLPAVPSCKRARMGMAHAREVVLTNISMSIKYS